MPIESFENHSPRVHRAAFVHPGAWLIGDVEIGEDASIWPTAVLRGDHGLIHIGPRTSIQDGSVAHATIQISETRIGAECTVGHRAILHGCIVGDRCLVGMGSILMDNAKIGDESFIAAGSLIPPGKEFPARSFIVGAPARRTRDVTDKELMMIQFSWQSYQDLARRQRAFRQVS